jgi:hypothetical protein
MRTLTAAALAVLAALAALAAGCGSAGSSSSSGGKLTWEVPKRAEGYTDPESRMRDWRRVVLANAHRPTLERLRASTQATLTLLASRDHELASRPPHLVEEARVEIRQLAEDERERLKLIDQRLAGR